MEASASRSTCSKKPWRSQSLEEFRIGQGLWGSGGSCYLIAVISARDMCREERSYYEQKA